MAALSIEAASTPIESLFERMSVLARADKAIMSDTVHEAFERLQAAKDFLEQLLSPPLGRAGA